MAAGSLSPDDRNMHHVTTPPDPSRPDRETDRDLGRDAADPAPDEKREAPARLSLTQVVASSLAAVSTTVLLSYFGTAGTIVGAGIASALTVVANYVYTRSIQKTREQLIPVVGKVVQVTTGASSTPGHTTTTVVSVPRRTGGDAGTTSPLRDHQDADDLTGADDPGGTIPDATSTDATGTDAGTVGTTDVVEPTTGDDPEREVHENAWLRLVDRYGRGRVLTVTTLALFVVVMAVVLVVELFIGKPLSDAVRGVEGSGTTISSTRSTGTQDPATPGPSTPAEDPTTVPTQDPTPTPSTTPTDEPTTTPTDDATEEPTTDPTDPATDPGTDPQDETGGDDAGTGTGAGASGGTETGAGTGTGAEAEPTPAPSTPAAS